MTPALCNRVYEALCKARGHVFDAVRPLSAEQYTQAHPIALGSLARTLHHIRAAEWFYLQRINGRTESLQPAPPEHDPDLGEKEGDVLPTFEALERAWRAQAERAAGDIERAASDAAQWTAPVTFHTEWDGEPYAYHASPADFFVQLVTHEVHHRAQAVHMLKRLGVELPEIDYSALMFEPANMRES